MIAAVPALGLDPEDFLRAYAVNRRDAVELAIGAHPVSVAILRLIERESAWEGTATQLLERFVEVSERDEFQSDDWPKNPAGLGSELRRVEPALEESGILVDYYKTNDSTRERRIRLSRRTPPDTDGQQLYLSPSEAKLKFRSE